MSKVASAKPAVDNRRMMLRYPSSRCAVIMLDTDIMELGIDATLSDVSPAGLGLSMEAPLAVGQHVRVKLTNDIQRFQKVVRGIVRHVTNNPNEGIRVGIEIFNRLTPLELLTLKMGLAAKKARGRKLWV